MRISMRPCAHSWTCTFPSASFGSRPTVSAGSARCGQEAVTSMLRVLARTLRNTVWPTDFVGRWSDNQFLVILSGCGEDAVQLVGRRVVSLLSGATIHWWGEELSMPVLIGHAAAQ